MNLQNKSGERIGVVGTGEYAAAITNRLLSSGYDVTIGSRNPEKKNLLVDNCLCNFSITSIRRCIEQSDIIILAIHAENYKDTLSSFRDILSDKILVDVSNRLSSSKEQSYAEYLAAIFPSARVVKAFNVIPACEMKRGSSRDDGRIFIAGNDIAAKRAVASLANHMGFYSVDRGPIQSARSIEDYNSRLFPEWRGAALTTVGIFNVWLVYVILMVFAEKRTESWNQLFLKVVNKPICLTAITLMAICLLPKPLAMLGKMMFSGKRKSPFWFQNWLQSMTQLGVLSFVFMAMHVVMSVLLANKNYFPSLYEQLGSSRRCNLTEQGHSDMVVSDWMNWKGEAGLLLGLLAMVLFCVVALATTPGIRHHLSWREKRFTQSTVFYAALFLTLCHVAMTAVADWTSNVVWPFYHSTSFLCVILPSIVLLLSIFAALPCVRRIVKRKPTGVQFYDIGKDCHCPGEKKDGVVPMGTELTIFHERSRDGYRALIEEE